MNTCQSLRGLQAHDPGRSLVRARGAFFVEELEALRGRPPLLDRQRLAFCMGRKDLEWTETSIVRISEREKRLAERWRSGDTDTGTQR